MISAKPSNIVSWVRRRWQFLALIALILCFPIAIRSYFLTRIGIVLALFVINITGMTLLTRYAGVVSLGHAAFFALGAYLSAILTVRAGWNPWLSMAVAAGVTVVFAYLFSVPFLRLRRAYLAMATLGLGQVAFLLAKDLTEITGGVSGIPGIPHLRLGRFVLNEDWQLFYLIGCFVILFVFFTENIGQTRLGRAYQAIRTNETAARAMGIDVQWELSRLFCYSALVSALAGSLLAHFITFISPESFTIDFSFTLLIIVIIGGANIWGTLATAIVLIGFSEVFRGLQDLSMGFYGLLLILSLFVFPEGLSAVLISRGTARREKSPNDLEPVLIDLQNPGSCQAAVQTLRSREGNILELSHISKNFGGTEALSRVSVTVDYHQIVGIIGPNGAGKTTLLNVVNGFLPPREGRVIFQGKDATNKTPHEMARLGLGRTFQLINLFKGMTVIENVMVGGHLKGRSGILMGGLNLGRPRHEERIIRNAAMRSLEFLGLVDRAYHVVQTLPFGEQKLVELARALAMEPDLLLLDEPAAGLNSAETERLSSILRRIRDRGVTIVLVEHNMPLVMSLSDLVFVLDFGCAIAFGTPEEVSRNKEVIRAYLGQEA
jgi:branched-chain amino acid transport system ATP-binding protein/branched-chain amino acid transport system permease protein